MVCVDPTSPFSGGAILGDRIRMQRHALDPGVFIRSLATRGHLGGLSRSTFDVAHVLDAMGYERILIETVGVGQDEVDVMKAAHTTVVVTVPGLGDDIQAIKAGLLEVADVLVVNKADREGADRTERDLMHMLDLRATGERKDVEIVRTIATRGTAEGSGITRARRGRSSATASARGTGAGARPSVPSRVRPRTSPSWCGRCSPIARRVRWRRAAGSARSRRPSSSARTDPWTVAEQLVEPHCRCSDGHGMGRILGRSRSAGGSMACLVCLPRLLMTNLRFCAGAVLLAVWSPAAA